MSGDIDKLCSIIAKIDLFGLAGETPPHLGALAKDVQEAAPLLPPVFAAAYTEPLTLSLQRLIRILAKSDPTMLETLTAAVYQHGSGEAQLAQLRRFLAVISDLYRSFLDKDKRTSAATAVGA